MTAFDLASAGTFASLGVVALAMVLLSRAHSARAIIIGLVGMLTLSAGATSLIQTGPQYAVPTIDKLQNQIAANEHQLKDTEEKLKKTEEQLMDALARERNAPAPKPPSLGPSPAAPVVACGTEPGRGTSVPMDRQCNKASQDIGAEVERLRAEASKLAATVALNKHREEWRVEHSRRIDTQDYSMTPYPETQLVSGLQGSWYVIRLKINDTAFAFRARQFRQSEAASALANSLNHLIEEELAPVAEVSITRRLFLRGCADPPDVSGPTERPDKRELAVLSRQSDGIYAARTTSRPVADPIRNADLPGLRAAWLGEQVRPMVQPLKLATTDLEILENPPAAGQERTAEIIFYVEW